MSATNSPYLTNGYTYHADLPAATSDRAMPRMADQSELTREHQLLAILPAMLFTSHPDGAWDYVNPSFCAYTGRPEESLVGMGWAAALHADDRASSLRHWHSAISSGAPLQVEHRLHGADGAHRWFRTQCTPQRNLAGAITRWAGITTPVDIDQQLVAERTLRRVAELALDEHNGVIATAAHELRAPLTVLLGQANLLQRRLGSREGADPGDRHAADMLVEQAIRLARLISSLLDAAQIERGQLLVSPTTLDLGALVRRVLQTLQPAVPTHTLRLIEDATPLWVMGDVLRLEQVLQNLLQNAVKYSQRGSEIVIAVRPNGDQAQVAVSDRGIGIAPSLQPHLFQRYFRASLENVRMTSGLGIGLYISKAIMDLHSGSIKVESDEGAGSTFTLLLPRIPPVERAVSGGAR